MKYCLSRNNGCKCVNASRPAVSMCVCLEACSQNLRKATTSIVTSVRWNNSAPTGPIFMKFDIWGFFRIIVEKIKVPLKSDKNKCTLYEDQYTFLIISRSFILRMKNISDEIFRENQNTHFVIRFFFSKILQFMRLCGKNMVQPDRLQMTISYNKVHSHCLLGN